jgi:hypothetical protein
MNTSVSSISFVITAIYTGTFANALYQVLEFDEKAVHIQFRSEITTSALICVAICMIMALRFFFGNNNFIEGLFARKISSVRRLYHFSVTSIQSLILLGSSYLIRNTITFTKWLIVLFAFEVIWYVGCLLWDRAAISKPTGKLDMPLLKNEVANVMMAGGGCIALIAATGHPKVLISIVAILFGVNTVIDLRVNLKSYMGET